MAHPDPFNKNVFADALAALGPILSAMGQDIPNTFPGQTQTTRGQLMSEAAQAAAQMMAARKDSRREDARYQETRTERQQQIAQQEADRARRMDLEERRVGVIEGNAGRKQELQAANASAVQGLLAQPEVPGAGFSGPGAGIGEPVVPNITGGALGGMPEGLRASILANPNAAKGLETATRYAAGQAGGGDGTALMQNAQYLAQTLNIPIKEAAQMALQSKDMSPEGFQQRVYMRALSANFGDSGEAEKAAEAAMNYFYPQGSTQPPGPIEENPQEAASPGFFEGPLGALSEMLNGISGGVPPTTGATPSGQTPPGLQNNSAGGGLLDMAKNAIGGMADFAGGLLETPAAGALPVVGPSIAAGQAAGALNQPPAAQVTAPTPTPGAAAPVTPQITGPPKIAPPRGRAEMDAMYAEAEAAIASGKNPQAIRQRIIDMGGDPAEVGL